MKNSQITRFVSLSLSLAAVMVLCSCATVPYTGRKQVMLYSVQEENQLGEEAWQEVQKQSKPTTNPQYQNVVTRVGQNISAVAEKPDFQWEYKVFQSNTPNAFCLPGGKVAVYSSIFQYMDNDAELAAVMGHEISHALARHSGERLSQDTMQSVGGTAITLATNQELYATAFGMVSDVGVILPYSRTQEYEADYLGLLLMAKAGYDPRAAVKFWEKFSKVSETSSFGEYFSTHPMSEKRIEELKKKMPEALELYNKCKVKRGVGMKFR
jgi:predicted Zn-dependent protease